MKTHLALWGNSLAVRIPRALAAELSLSSGVEVELKAEEGSLIVVPVGRPRYELEDLVKEMSEDNTHGELDWGPSVGGEVW